MRRIYFRYLVIGFVISSSLWATDVAWILFQVNHTYNDSTINCESARRGNTLYFATEIEEGKPTRAAFNSNLQPRGKDDTLTLTQEELSQIDLFSDSQGRYWVKKLPLNDRLLKWMLFMASHGLPKICVLPQRLQTISPAPITFEFEPEDLEEFQIGHSRKISFSGVLLDGDAYRVKMQLVQREFRFRRW